MILTWAVPEKYQTRKRGVEDIYTFLKTPLEFLDLSLYTLRKSVENKLSPLEILQNCVTPLRNSKSKNQDPWKFHMIFSWTPLEILLFFVDAWNFHMLTSMPLEIPCPQHAVLIFSGIAHYLAFVDQNKNWSKHLKHYLKV